MRPRFARWLRCPPHAPESEGNEPAVDELAYDQVQRALDQQAGALNELRQRTGTLVGVSSLVATFLGGQSLRAPGAERGPEWLVLVSLAALLVGIAGCIGVLTPTRMRKRRATRARAGLRRRARGRSRPRADQVVALSFSANVETMLDHAEQDLSIEMPQTVRMSTARTLQLHWDENQSIIEGKQQRFTLGCWALFVQTASWIAFLALGGEVI